MAARLVYIFLLVSGYQPLQAQVNTDSLASASLAREDSTHTVLQRVSLNSAYSDYSPFLHGDNFYFVSDRPRQAGVQYVDLHDQTSIADLYVARRRNSTNFSRPALLKEVSGKYHEGPLSVGADSLTMLLTANDKSGRNKIYRSVKHKGKWAAPELLEICRDEFSYCHPALSHNGRLLAFCSDMPGQGGMDIFISEFENGRWSEPRNAGPGINSAGNELFPFLAGDDRLYFSSNRPGGHGQLDLYTCEKWDTGQAPELLPHPFNSPSDDFGIWLDQGLQNGYLSTNRAGSLKDDIYYFSRIIPDFSKAKEPAVKTSFCYNFFEETSLSTHDTTNLEFEWELGDGSKKRGLRARHCYSSPGVYVVKLNVVERLSGEIFNSLIEYELNILTPEKLYISCQDTLHPDDTLFVDGTRSAIKGFTIRKTFWSFGDGRYNSGSAVKHVYRKPGVYQLEQWVIAINNESNREEKFKTVKKIVVVGK